MFNIWCRFCLAVGLACGLIHTSGLIAKLQKELQILIYSVVFLFSLWFNILKLVNPFIISNLALKLRYFSQLCMLCALSVATSYCCSQSADCRVAYFKCVLHVFPPWGRLFTLFYHFPHFYPFLILGFPVIWGPAIVPRDFPAACEPQPAPCQP